MKQIGFPFCPPAPPAAPPAAALPKRPVVLYLVGCGKSKRAERSRAKDLYTGNLFRAARAHAERHGSTWRILSAKHRVINPERMVKPYDVRVPRTREDRHVWAATMATELENEFRGVELEIVCLAGAAYVDEISRRFSRRGFKVSTPLQGLGLGARLAWFKAQAERSAEGLSR